MSPRSEFTSVGNAAQGVGGNNNLGVVIVRSHRDGNNYIEKRVHPDAISIGWIQREVRIMQQCRGHPNIVSIHSYDLSYRSSGYGSIFMQRAELGSLDALLLRFERRRVGLPDEGIAWKVFWDLSIALAYLWTGRDAQYVRQAAQAGRPITNVAGWDAVVHRDLKPSNVFMTNEGPLQLDSCPYPTMLLGDFGSAVSVSEIASGRARCDRIPGNDPMFAPPEYPNYSEHGDVFSLGLILLCVVYQTQEPPIVALVESSRMSAHMAALLTLCMQQRQSRRPTPKTLPNLVWSGYSNWRKERNSSGSALPAWAYGNQYIQAGGYITNM